MFSEDENFQSDALLTICGKILHDFPTLDINEFINSNKSNYLAEEFTNQISSVEEEDDTQLPSPAPKNVIPHKSISTEKRKKRLRSKNECTY